MAKSSKEVYNAGGRLPCSSCGSDLHFLNADEMKKTKGVVMLYCPLCSRKHYGPIEGLKQLAADLKSGKTARPIPPNPPIKEEPLVDNETTTEDVRGDDPSESAGEGGGASSGEDCEEDSGDD